MDIQISSNFERLLFEANDRDAGAVRRAMESLKQSNAFEIEEGALKTTLSKVITPINAANLRSVHAKLESGSAIGKIVLSGW